MKNSKKSESAIFKRKGQALQENWKFLRSMPKLEGLKETL